MDRAACLERWTANSAQGTPILGAGAGTGLSAKCAEAGGADLIEDGKTGYLVSNVHAIEEIAERIDEHLSLSSAERAAMSIACWETARKMTVEKNARETCELFEEVLREKFRV